MRVLFVSLLTYEKVGGIETFNKYFIKSLKMNNIKTTVISFHDKVNIDNSIACDSNLWFFVKTLLQEVKKNDIVIWGHINLLPIFMLFKYINDTQNILIVHGVEVWYKLSIFKEFMLNKMDYILSVSNFTKHKLIDVCQVKENKVKIFPNCIELKNNHTKLNPYNNKKFNILTMLRVDESYKLQSIINILDAMKILQDDSIFFTIIGKGNKIDYIQDEVNNRSLQNQVILKGFVEDTAPYLEYCDIFTLISDREGFGIVYLEAMQYNKSCLSANGCGSSDVVVDGYNGFSFDMNDIENLAKKINLLKKDNSLRNKLGLNGRKLLEEKFTFNIYKKNQKRVISEIMDLAQND